MKKSTISSRSKSSCEVSNESRGDARNEKAGLNTSRCHLEEGSSDSRSRSMSLKRSTFSSRSKSKDRCDIPIECASAFRSRSLKRSTMLSRSRSRNGIDEDGCAHGRREGSKGKDRESKSGATRSESRGRSSSMVLMPCMRGANNSLNRATASGGDSNNKSNRCRRSR